ncbi:MAG: Smr/MutS family protein [Alphaproteobacteria bacterium]
MTKKDNIWDIVKKSITPLKKANVYRVDEKPAKKSVAKKSKTETKQADFKISQAPLPPAPKPKTETKVGDTTGLNKSHAKKLRTKNLDVDMVIDLHGLTQDQAFNKVQTFMTTAINNNCKTVKIITGKGKGILQSQVPKWLNDSDLAPFVLSVVHAPQRHGGTGALLIALKQKR